MVILPVLDHRSQAKEGAAGGALHMDVANVAAVRAVA